MLWTRSLPAGLVGIQPVSADCSDGHRYIRVSVTSHMLLLRSVTIQHGWNEFAYNVVVISHMEYYIDHLNVNSKLDSLIIIHVVIGSEIIQPGGRPLVIPKRSIDTCSSTPAKPCSQSTPRCVTFCSAIFPCSATNCLGILEPSYVNKT